MELRVELQKLKEFMDKGDETNSKKQVDFINGTFTSEDEQRIIEAFVLSGISDLTAHTKTIIRDTEVRIRLIELSEVVSLSYIARQYFNKTRSWLYQKMNGSLKNGKPAKFTPDELSTLNFALQDISKKIGSITFA